MKLVIAETERLARSTMTRLFLPPRGLSAASNLPSGEIAICAYSARLKSVHGNIRRLGGFGSVLLRHGLHGNDHAKCSSCAPAYAKSFVVINGSQSMPG